MWLRATANNPLRDAGTMEITIDRTGERSRDTKLNPALLDNPDFRFFLQFHRPDVRSAWTTTNRAGREILSISTTDGAWCEFATAATNEAHFVTYNRASDLRASIEDIAASWRQHGSPSQEQLGLTIDADGEHLLWCDTPSRVIAELPT